MWVFLIINIEVILSLFFGNHLAFRQHTLLWIHDVLVTASNFKFWQKLLWVEHAYIWDEGVSRQLSVISWPQFRRHIIFNFKISMVNDRSFTCVILFIGLQHQFSFLIFDNTCYKKQGLWGLFSHIFIFLRNF